VNLAVVVLFVGPESSGKKRIEIKEMANDEN